MSPRHRVRHTKTRVRSVAFVPSGDAILPGRLLSALQTGSTRSRQRARFDPNLSRFHDPRPAVVNTLDRVMTDAQIQHRGMVSELHATEGRHARVMGNPMVFKETAAVANSFPPALGENTAAVLRRALGASDGEIAALVRAGAIVAADFATEATASA